MLNDWYLSKKKDYSTFELRQPPSLKILEQRAKVAAMYDWVKEEKIRSTPTFFLNGYQLPDAYSVEDIKYFLLE